MSDVPLLPESMPAWGNSLVGQPPWMLADGPDSDIWTPLFVFNSGLTSIPEIGYDEGGYGQDGYDTQTLTFPSASTPNWTVDLLK